MSNAINIGSRRELFWDEYLINTGKTTAELKLHKLQSKEVVIDHNEPWEGDGCNFHCIIMHGIFYPFEPSDLFRASDFDIRISS